MAPRLNKRRQRESEQLQALGAHNEDSIPTDSETEGPPSIVQVPAKGFAALLAPDGDEQDGSLEEDSAPDEPAQPTSPRKAKKNKKKKKKKDQTPTSATALPSENIDSAAGLTNKGKAKEKKTKMDEIDEALADLSLKYPDFRNPATSTPNASTSTQTSLASLLSVSLPHLDSEAEMRKFFGSKVVAASKASVSHPGARRQQFGAQRSNLTRPKPAWSHTRPREGLSLRALSDAEMEEGRNRHTWPAPVDGEKWWTVEDSKKYRSTTMAFMQTVISGDPQGFWALINYLSWHADTLLQLAEIYRHQEEYSEAVDFVDRALFTYERSFIGAFNFTSGLNRLDYDRVQNRPFFLAVHRQITDLQRRGCVRTAFEFARLLFSIEPASDPHGALLHLDFLAMKAGMAQWLLDAWDHYDEKWAKHVSERTRINATCFPGWAYARALALRNIYPHDLERSQRALEAAILAFPSVVPLLADKLDLPLTTEIRRKKQFAIQTDASGPDSESVIHLLSHLYVQRSSPLWKDPTVSSWFSSTVLSLGPRMPTSEHFLRSRSLQYFSSSQDATRAVWRHVITLEATCRSLFAFIPKAILNARSLACDPLPPLTAVSLYDGEFFKDADEGLGDLSASLRRTRRAEERRLLEIRIPDPVFRAQLQAVFDAHPRFAERFPGGILQFAEIAGELPEDVLEDMMIHEVVGDAQGMPGAMPEEDYDATDNQGAENGNDGHGDDDGSAEGDRKDEDDEGEEEREEDEEDEPDSFPLQLMRNLVGRFWGSGSQRRQREPFPSDPDDGPDTSDEEGEQEDGHPVDGDVD